MSREKAIEHFKMSDPVLYKEALPFYHTFPSRLRREQDEVKLFAMLCRSIIGQQLSTKAAETIRTRLFDACAGVVTPQKITSLQVEAMRSFGISEAKVRSIKELAHMVHQKEIELSKLHTIKEEEARDVLCRVRGIGPWTADMFLMCALGRNDIFSPNDLGLLLGIMNIDALSEKPTKEYAVSRSEAWKPYRTWASLFLWKIKDTKAD